jgi:Subtilase family/Bacterial pre-peptidase C-terminal domain/FG-GAP-like repeat
MLFGNSANNTLTDISLNTALSAQVSTKYVNSLDTSDSSDSTFGNRGSNFAPSSLLNEELLTQSNLQNNLQNNLLIANNFSSDILWRHYGNGQDAFWSMNGTTHQEGVYITPVSDFNWRMEGSGDFNNDGKGDIIWRNYRTGENAIWLMDGNTLVGGQGIYITPVSDLSWRMEGAGDFNNDGKSDIIWRNYRTGENAIWLMNGTTLIGGQGVYTTPVSDLSWRMEGAGDFNADGKSDIIWRNYLTGENAIWLMDGTTLMGGQGVYTTPVYDLSWRMEGAGDFNNDGKSDIIWRNYRTGENAIWLMDGTTLNQGQGVYTTPVTDLNWEMVSTRRVYRETNNSLEQASNLGVLNGNQSFPDFVSITSDSNDYYRFTLNSNTSFRINLNGLSADADIQLLNSDGNIIGRSTNSTNSEENINIQLASGTYYIRVYAYLGATTSYNLNLSSVPANPAFNSTYGYGLVDSAAAVARAIGQSRFTDVPDLGGNNWGNDMVNAPEVWTRGFTGQGITVAVIDSGVDINHQDLRDNIWQNYAEIAGNGIDDDGNGYIDDVNGWNFGVGQYNGNVLPGTNSFTQSHGTHVAGTIAAMNNNYGVTGVAYNSRIMALRLGDTNNQGSFTNAGSLAEAIRYAVNNGARVINMSLGWSDSPELRDALAYAASRNVITVSAAGNDSSFSPGNPAQYATDYGISVGAVDRNRTIASFSNRAGSDSRMQHVVAPGVSVYSTTPGNNYGFSSGTSMATPHVAGVIALMLSANSNLTHAQIRQILTETARIV